MENIDWSALGFDYHKTDVNVRYYFTDGKWSDMEVTSDEYIKMHMSASCLHYGIELFEGLKAFRGVDGKVRLFRVEDNARRLRSSAERLCLPLPTVEMVVNACKGCFADCLLFTCGCLFQAGNQADPGCH